MKRKYIYLLASLIIILSIIASYAVKGKRISYAYGNYSCSDMGYYTHPYIRVYMYPNNGTSSQTMYFTSSNVTSDDLPRVYWDGYSFMGWYMGGELLNYHVTPISYTVHDPETGNYYTLMCYKETNISVEGRWEKQCYYETPIVDFITNSETQIGSSNISRVTSQYNNNSLPIPEKNDYTFAGWYVDSGLNEAFNGHNYRFYTYYDNYNCLQDRTQLFAKWEPKVYCPTENEYNLYYVSNGGTSIPMEYRVGSASSVTFNFPTPTKSGYTFDGWYRDPSLTTPAAPKVNGISFVTREVNSCPVFVGNVYAKWTEKPVVSPDNPDNPSNLGTPTDETSEPSGSDESSGSSSSESSSGSGKDKNKDKNKDGSTVKTCPNVVNKLQLHFETDEGTKLDDMEICLTCDEEEVTLPKPEKDGKNFVGWYTDETLVNEVLINGLNTEIELSKLKVKIDKNDDGCLKDVAKTTLYAMYEDATCKTPTVAYLDINYEAGDTVTQLSDVKKCLDCDEDYYELPVLTRTGYLFGGWYIDEDYSRLVSKKINVDNAIKYMNVTRKFEDGCSTDTVTTMLYAKWIPISSIKNVMVMFISQGSIVTEQVYGLNDENIKLPELNIKGVKLLGWYADNAYTTPLVNIKDLLNSSYGYEVRDGQLFLYAYAKTEEVEGPDYKKVFIIAAAIIAAAGIGYFVINKKKEDSSDGVISPENNNSNNY